MGQNKVIVRFMLEDNITVSLACDAEKVAESLVNGISSLRDKLCPVHRRETECNKHPQPEIGLR